MKNEYNLSFFSMFLLGDDHKDLTPDLDKFNDRDCRFYYDETNNIRKLWMKEEGFNAPVEKDFVLGGVMSFGNFDRKNIDVLKSKIKLQKSAPELKFKHLADGADFLSCLSIPKVKLFLEWLDQSGLYIHSSNVNNLYWTIVDIIDEVKDERWQPYVLQNKNELYKIANANYEQFYDFLYSFNYPNISDKRAFYQGLIRIVEGVKTTPTLTNDQDRLRQCLKQGKRETGTIFLGENPERIIIDSYFWFYARPLGVFAKSRHVFDNENKIKAEFDNWDFSLDGKRISSYSFADSKSEPMIQIADCITGLLGKFYTFVNTLTKDQIPGFLSDLTNTEKATLKLLSQIIKRSNDYSQLLLHSSESREEHDVALAIMGAAIDF